MDAEPDYEALSARLGECCDNLLKLRARVLWADLYAQALSAGRAYARAYGEAKRLAGAVDFDDLIRKTVHLLNENRSEEHTSELQSLMRISYAVFCLKKKKQENKQKKR